MRFADGLLVATVRVPPEFSVGWYSRVFTVGETHWELVHYESFEPCCSGLPTLRCGLRGPPG
jgi:hypothetical protein